MRARCTPNDNGMTSIRNLPLAARLGGAFGVLCVALAIVAFAGINSMHNLRDKADELGERHIEAAQHLGVMQKRAKDNVSLITQHLYVRDGDLAAEDKIFGEIEANWAASKKDAAMLDRLFEGTPAQDELDAFVEVRAEMLAVQKRCSRARARRPPATSRTAAPPAPNSRRSCSRSTPSSKRPAKASPPPPTRSPSRA